MVALRVVRMVDQTENYSVEKKAGEKVGKWVGNLAVNLVDNSVALMDH